MPINAAAMRAISTSRRNEELGRKHQQEIAANYAARGLPPPTYGAQQAERLEKQLADAMRTSPRNQELINFLQGAIKNYRDIDTAQANEARDARESKERRERGIAQAAEAEKSRKKAAEAEKARLEKARAIKQAEKEYDEEINKNIAQRNKEEADVMRHGFEPSSLAEIRKYISEFGMRPVEEETQTPEGVRILLRQYRTAERMNATGRLLDSFRSAGDPDLFHEISTGTARARPQDNRREDMFSRDNVQRASQERNGDDTITLSNRDEHGKRLKNISDRDYNNYYTVMRRGSRAAMDREIGDLFKANGISSRYGQVNEHEMLKMYFDAVDKNKKELREFGLAPHKNEGQIVGVQNFLAQRVAKMNELKRMGFNNIEEYESRVGRTLDQTERRYLDAIKNPLTPTGNWFTRNFMDYIPDHNGDFPIDMNQYERKKNREHDEAQRKSKLERDRKLAREKQERESAAQAAQQAAEALKAQQEASAQGLRAPPQAPARPAPPAPAAARPTPAPAAARPTPQQPAATTTSVPTGFRTATDGVPIPPFSGNEHTAGFSPNQAHTAASAPEPPVSGAGDEDAKRREEAIRRARERDAEESRRNANLYGQRAAGERKQEREGKTSTESETLRGFGSQSQNPRPLGSPLPSIPEYPTSGGSGVPRTNVPPPNLSARGGFPPDGGGGPPGDRYPEGSPFHIPAFRGNYERQPEAAPFMPSPVSNVNAPSIRPPDRDRTYAVDTRLNAPEGVQAQRAELLRRQFNNSQTPYRAYPSSRRYEPESAEELHARKMAAMTGVYRQHFQESDNLRNQGAGTYPENHDYYMDPYREQVLEMMERRSKEDFDKNVMPALHSRAIKMGGGHHSLSTTNAILKAQAEREEHLRDAQLRYASDQYNQNANTYQTDMARKLEASRMAAQTGQGLHAGHLADTSAMERAGERYRGIRNERNEHDYGQYQELVNRPMNQTGQALNTYNGVPFNSTQMQQAAQSGTALHKNDWRKLLAAGAYRAARRPIANMAGDLIRNFASGIL